MVFSNSITRVKIVTKNAKHIHRFGKLVLEDGTVFDGTGFGYPTTAFGEAVFNTGMVGYTEALTDPSYCGQILTLTYPLVGNYGVPSKDETDEDGIPRFFESNKIQPRGLIVHELSTVASHRKLTMTLDEWLYSEKIPGVSGVDTRELTQILRSKGVMMAAIKASDTPIDESELKENLSHAQRYGAQSFMGDVSTDKVVSYGSKGNNENDAPQTVVVVDTGVKNAIIRNLRSLGYRVIRVPWNTPFEKIMSFRPRGVVISNGPGDPQNCKQTMDTATSLLKEDVPTLGICLGAQILGLAGGAKTYKLKYGHRGQNKPCIDTETGKVYVTSQNHGYCIDPDSLKDSAFDVWFTNADDKTVEGIKHKDKDCVAVQFHPEASPGPFDCKFVFERLKSIIEEKAGLKNKEKKEV